MRNFAKVGDKVRLWLENENIKFGKIIEIIKNNTNMPNNENNKITKKKSADMQKNWSKKKEIFVNKDTIMIECETEIGKIYEMTRDWYEWSPIIIDEIAKEQQIQIQCPKCKTYTTRIEDHLQNICPKNLIQCVLCNDNTIERQNLTEHWKFHCTNYKINKNQVLVPNQHYVKFFVFFPNFLCVFLVATICTMVETKKTAKKKANQNTQKNALQTT